LNKIGKGPLKEQPYKLTAHLDQKFSRKQFQKNVHEKNFKSVKIRKFVE
jgi:hypothetical protein